MQIGNQFIAVPLVHAEARRGDVQVGVFFEGGNQGFARLNLVGFAEVALGKHDAPPRGRVTPHDGGDGTQVGNLTLAAVYDRL
jgi:hypothetical protein